MTTTLPASVVLLSVMHPASPPAMPMNELPVPSALSTMRFVVPKFVWLHVPTRFAGTLPCGDAPSSGIPLGAGALEVTQSFSVAVHCV